MDNNVLFRETQKFRSAILWLFLAAMVSFLLYMFIQQIIFEIPFGNNPMSDAGLILFFICFGIGFPMLFYFANLTTEVRSDGIYYKFSPIHINWKKIPYCEIKSYEIKKYSPIRTYGGYGIRYSMSGKAYNVSGSNGLLLKLSNGKRVLFGTQEPDRFKDALDKAIMMKCYS